MELGAGGESFRCTIKILFFSASVSNQVCLNFYVYVPGRPVFSLLEELPKNHFGIIESGPSNQGPDYM